MRGQRRRYRIDITRVCRSEFAVDSSAVLARAAESGCTACDCGYVARAEDLGVPLVTSDKQVLAAFPDRAVALDRYAEQ